MNGRAIGVFDSGVGGLTVFRALERVLPGESLLYLGDTARVPYGTRSAETVMRYALDAIRFMQSMEVKMVVVACNTASSVAIEAMQEEADVPVLGVILPGAHRAAVISRSGAIGVIGTRATVGSGAYERAILERRPNAEVISRACPLFVPLAEEGWTDNPTTVGVAEHYLEPFKRAEVDTLVMGCTHYPLLEGVIGRVMGPGVRLVDSAESTAAEVSSRLREKRSIGDGNADGEIEHRFFVTDMPEPFQEVAERFLGRSDLKLERADLQND